MNVRDYQVSVVEALGHMWCRACNQPASQTVLGFLILGGERHTDAVIPCCETHVDDTRERMHGEYHRRLYGELPKQKRQGAA